MSHSLLLLLVLALLEDVRVTSVDDSHASNSEEFTASGSEFSVVSVVWDVLNVGKHSQVLQLTLSDSWEVIGDEDQLSLSLSSKELGYCRVRIGSLPDRFQGALESQGNLSRSHNDSECGVQTFLCIFDHFLCYLCFINLPE